MAYNFKYGDITNCKVRNGQTRTEYQCRLGWDYAAEGNQSSSQSIESNATQVILQLEARSINSTYRTEGTGQTTIIDNTTVTSNARIDMSNTNVWQVLGQKTMWITHNPDGTLNISKSGSFTCTAGSSDYSLRSGSASVTVAPATIPRASEPTLSASSVAMGSSVTITTNRKSDSFTHTLTYKFGNASGTIASGVGEKYDWKPSIDLANQIPNNYEGTCTITCQTYNGSDLVGTKTTTVKLTVPDTVKPVINSVTITEGGTTIPSSWGVYVQGKSSLKVVTDAKGAYGSTITAYKITGIDNVTYNKASFTSAILQQAVTYKIKVVVTDSRTRTAEKEVQVTCVAYSNPSISVATVTRCNADGTENEEGTYVKYTFKASVSAVSNKNTYSYKLGYKLNTGDEYTYITISNSSYTLSKTDEIISGVTFSVDNSYDFQFYVADYFTPTSIVRTLGTGFTLMDFRYSGKGMAIGKVSEKDALEIDLPTEINEATNLNLKADGTNIAYKQGNVPILRYNGTDATILSSSGNTNSMIYLRPNGTTSSDGQVTINSSGLITGTITNANSATNANNATYVTNTLTNPTAITNYYPPFMINNTTGSTNSIRTNNGFFYRTLEGTASAQGWGILNLGNGTSTGTAGNKTGAVRIYSAGAGYGEFNAAGQKFTTNYTYTLPAYSGTLVGEKSKSIVNNYSGNSSYIVLGSLLICWGRIAITPTANTPTKLAVTFPRAFTTVPSVMATPVSSAPYTIVRGVGVSDTTTTGVDIYLTRTNTTATSIDWFAIGQA